MKIKNITLTFLFIGITAFSQKAETPNFTYDLGGKIDFMTLTDSGVLIVAGSGGFSGIKPGASTAHFSFKDYGKVKQEELSFVPLSPYVVISQGGVFSTKKTVIDIVTGKKLFATEDNGFKYTSRADVILPQNKLVVSGTKKDGTISIGIYDLATGKEEGMVALNDPKKVGIATVIEFTGAPTMIDGGLILPTSKSLMRIDLANGSVLWNNKDIDKISWVTSDASGKEIYAFEERQNGDTRIHKVSSSGQKLWEKERKIKGKVSRFEILPQGLAVVSDVDNSDKSGIMRLASASSESKIAFLSAKDGTDLWEKAPKTKGYVQHFYIMEDGILFGMFEGGINKISFEGNTLYKKPLKTGENIHTMALTPNGMIYITDTDTDIINLNSGESVWSKPIKYKKAKEVASTYDAKNKRYLISTGNEVLAIDENTGDVTNMASIEFKEKEAPTSISVRNQGVLFTSAQNMMMIGFDGSNKWQEYYASPGKSTAGKIFSGVMGAASMAVASTAAFKAGANKNAIGQYNSEGEQAKIIQDGFSDIASISFAEMAKRFKATKATENAQFILTKLSDGVGLVKINKDSGAKEKEIVLKDKKPEYEVDELGGFLYYKANDKTIYSYDLNK